MTKAVLSDMDGTLLDSNWLHASSWRDAFARFGIDVDVEEVRRQIGKGGDELIPVFVPESRRKELEEPLKASRKEIFEAKYLSQVKPVPKVRELFLRMKDAGITIAIASSAKGPELERFKEIAGIADLVEANTSSDDADHAKPNPDIFQAALQKVHLPADQVLALGDTPWDAEAAGKAGIQTVGVTTGGWTKQQLREAGCIAVYTDVAELLEQFDASPFVRQS